MNLQLRTRELCLDQPLVMGILNVTPDSFSDGGAWPTPELAFAQAQRMVEQGAAIIDIGGESTRPGSGSVAEQVELDRVIPAIERIRQRLECVISIDTMKPAVMRAAVAAGAELINDVNALRADGAVQAAADSGAAVCLMHMQGQPRTMQAAPGYRDVVGEVIGMLAERVLRCREAGIATGKIVIDPGIGFGKSLEHNLQLLANIDQFCALGWPVLIGASRKSLFQKLLGLGVEQRLIPSVTVASLAVTQGVQIIRAHDIAETVQAIRTAHAIGMLRAPKMQA